MASLGNRLRHAWNVFVDRDQRNFQTSAFDIGSGYSVQPSRSRHPIINERTIISSIYTHLSIDVASTEIRHVRLDESGRYLEDVESGLNECLLVEANIDQAATAFRQDIVLTMFEYGVAAIVPVDTTINPMTTGGYDIKTMRVGNVTQWYPEHVRVSLYNQKTGLREEVVIQKKNVAIVENPLYNVMNEPNSTLQRLIRKLSLLDVVDEQSSSGKLDIIIQLPYVIKSDARRAQAEQRRKDIEDQLQGSKYGVAYTDGTEKITQLNRSAENNLFKQVEYLTGVLYNQLGITEAVMNGTADEAAMLNYRNRSIIPILDAISEAMKRSFLTKTARSQRQSIKYFADPFKYVPITEIANIADVFTRNEIASSNEIRQVVGWKPSKDPKADKLTNANMPQTTPPEAGGEESQAALNELDTMLDGLFEELGGEPVETG